MVAPKKEYNANSERIGKMEISDYAQAEIYAERAKKKYLKNSKKKVTTCQTLIEHQPQFLTKLVVTIVVIIIYKKSFVK